MNNSALYSRLRANWPLGIILGVFVILCLVYTWATPPLEASDEVWHFGMVDWIADTGQLQLPVQQPGVKTTYEQEGSQPPLYYFLAALLVQGIDRSDFDEVTRANPHAVAGVPGYVGNKNLVLHDTPHPALQGSVLAIYVIRLFSMLCGAVTIIAIYLAARALELWQPVLPVLAAALTAFNPMFLFINSAINNDNLVTALNSIVIWQMVVMIRQERFSPWRSLVIAVFVTLSTLTKLSGLVLIPIVGLAALWVFIRPQLYAIKNNNEGKTRLQWHGLLTFIVLLGGLWMVFAGWWYLRNVTLYGELFGTQTMVAVAGPRLEKFSLQTLVDEFQGFRFAYWALFGAVNVMTFRWFYDVMDVLSLLSLLGLVTYVIVVWRKRAGWLLPENQQRLNNLILLILLVGIVLAGTVSVATWTAQTYASQGRLLFPFNAAISILGAVGLIVIGRYWFRPTLGRILNKNVYYALVVLMALFASIVPFASILPVYATPQPIEQLPEGARSVYARFGDVALIGYDVPDQRYFPGDNLPVTVYWQVLNPSTIDYSLYLHATLDDGTVIGKVDSYPGAGRLRTSRWQSGAIYADTYAIPLDVGSEGVSRLRIQVGWWDYASKKLVDAVDQSNQALSSVMLDAGGFAPRGMMQRVQDGIPLEPIRFGDQAELLGYQLEGDLLRLEWRSLGTFPADYTVFVQALDETNQMAAQGDSPPTLPTRYWQAGETFVTQHQLKSSQAILAGSYKVILGWYNSIDLTRLVAASSDNAYVLPVPFIWP